MSGKLYFELPAVLRLAEATLAAGEWADSWSDREEGRSTGPALIWAKDAGTYLMSNARPRPADDVLYARAGSRTGPVVDDDSGGPMWELARDICGGDDFAEYLTLKRDGLLNTLRAGASLGDGWLVLTVAEETVSWRSVA